MKRPIRPVSDYEGHGAYPSSQQVWLSRRAFLGRAASTAAVTAAGAAALGGEAGATPIAKRRRVTIHLDRYTQIGNSGLRAEKLVIFTGNKDFDRFLRKHSEQQRVKRALMKRLRKVKPETLYDGRKLYRLERSLGAIVSKQYRKRTGKGSRQPDVMLSLTRYFRYLRPGGVMIRPHFRPTP